MLEDPICDGSLYLICLLEQDEVISFQQEIPTACSHRRHISFEHAEGVRQRIRALRATTFWVCNDVIGDVNASSAAK